MFVNGERGARAQPWSPSERSDILPAISGG